MARGNQYLDGGRNDRNENLGSRDGFGDGRNLNGGGEGVDFVQNLGGGGGGGGRGSGGGGGSRGIRIIRGCTDRNAENYNQSANVNDGTCRYPSKPPTVLSESRTIQVNVTSTNGGSIMVDGKDTLSTPAKIFTYTGKQLLTPKYFKLSLIHI